MTKRLQVLIEDSEWREIQRAARARRLTVAEWVRQALRAARRQQPTGDPDRKLAALRAAVRHAFPSADIERMLEQIEHGYRGGEWD
jgi:hypothetical protein